jgi:hypothetical protein
MLTVNYVMRRLRSSLLHAPPPLSSQGSCGDYRPFFHSGSAVGRVDVTIRNWVEANTVTDAAIREPELHQIECRGRIKAT